MPIAVIFVVVAGAIALFVLYPHLRVITGAVVAIFVGVASIYFLLPGSADQARQSAITPKQLRLSDVDLTTTDRYTEVRGRVVNTADADLRSFFLRVTLQDCIEADSCVTIGEDEAEMRIIVPAGQARDFQGVLDFRDAATLRGTPKWDYDITRITASP
ncbi:hypothetical protein [Halovulum sp. GXIMD14793]